MLQSDKNSWMAYSNWDLSRLVLINTVHQRLGEKAEQFAILQFDVRYLGYVLSMWR